MWLPGMRIIAVEHAVPNAALPSPELLREEAAGLWRLHVQGTVRQAWFTNVGQDAVLELECPDEDHAARILNGLPLVEAGAIRFEVLGLHPYDGFARLFAP